MFVEIVNTRNMSTAAERSGLSSSTVGNHLSALEVHLDVRLLYRMTATVRWVRIIQTRPKSIHFLQRSSRGLPGRGNDC
ncbi:hypothetical protein DM992_29435 [Burkholderia sp. JP2-270]|nr:hypothetical protein DM992_29435 [Burkholderia sp. JP2-270]